MDADIVLATELDIPGVSVCVDCEDEVRDDIWITVYTDKKDWFKEKYFD